MKPLSRSTPSLACRLLTFTPPEGIDRAEVRRLALLQFCGLFGIGTMLALSALHAVAGAQTLALPIALSLGCIPFYVGVMVLNARGKAEGAKWLLCLVLTGSILLTTWAIVGKAPGMHFFFLLAATVPLLLWSKERKGTLAAFMAANLLGFLVVQFRADEAGLLVPQFPGAWVVFYEGASFVAVFVTIVALLLFFQSRADQDAEELAVKARFMEALMLKFEDLSRTDPLTGLLNRRAILGCLEDEAVRATRHQTAFSLLLVDIDRFKQVNDDHGHEAGDLVLKELSRDLVESLREVDRVGRWGGEEFLCLLPDTEEAGAEVVAEKIRRRIEDRTYLFGMTPLRCTVTLGVATHRGDSGFEETLRKADRALYDGKRTGRNRVMAG